MAPTLKPTTEALDTAPPGFVATTAKLDGERDGVLARLGDVGLSAAKGVIAVPEAAVGLANIASGGRAGKFLENEGGAVGFRPKQAKAYLDELKSDDQKAADAAVQGADGFLPTIGAMVRNPSTIVGAAAESVPLMFAGGVPGRAALAVAPRLGAVGAGALGEGVVGAGSAAEGYRQETADGLLTGTQSAIAAGSGAVTGAIGLGAGRVAARLGIGDVDTLIAGGKTPLPDVPVGTATKIGPDGTKTTTVIQKGLGRKLAEGVLTEGVLEETPQSGAEQLLQNVALDKPLGEGVGSAMGSGLLVGGIMGAGGAYLGQRGESKVVMPPVAPQTSPFSHALGLPKPGDAPIVVGPDGQAITPSQQLDEANASAERIRQRGKSPGDVTEVPWGAQGSGGYLDPQPTQPAPVGGPFTAATAGGVPPPQVAPAPPPPTTAELVADNERTSKVDRDIHARIFGGQDVTDARAKGQVSPLESLVTNEIEWDDLADEVQFLTREGFTDEEIRDAIAANRSSPATPGGASDARPQEAEPRATRPRLGRAEAPGQPSQEVGRFPRADLPIAPPGAPAAAPAQGRTTPALPAPERPGAAAAATQPGGSGRAAGVADRPAPGTPAPAPFPRERMGLGRSPGEPVTPARDAVTSRAVTSDVTRDVTPSPAGGGSDSGRVQIPETANSPENGTNSPENGTESPVSGKTEAPTLATYVTAKGKSLTGVWRPDLTLAEAKAIDGGSFFVKGKGAFIRERALSQLAARDAAQGAGNGPNVLDARVESPALAADAAPAADAGRGVAAAPDDERAALDSVEAPDAGADRGEPAGGRADGGAGRTAREDAGSVDDRAGRADRGDLAGADGRGVDPAPDAANQLARPGNADRAADAEPAGDPGRAAPAGGAGAAAAVTPGGPVPVGKAVKLYSQRRLSPASVAALTAWAKKVGFPSILDDLHVTLAYSSKRVDASAVPLASAPVNLSGRGRSLDKFGETVVLKLDDAQLRPTWQALKDAGASWDYPDYAPHVSITREPGSVNIDKIEPYRGPIQLLGEERSVLDDDAGEDTPEQSTDAAPAAAPAPETPAQRKEAAARAAWFTPGNVVPGLGGVRLDRVLSYQANDPRSSRGWSVTIQEVTRTADGRFEDKAGEAPETHSIPPTPRELREGPILTAGAAAPAAKDRPPANGADLPALFHGGPVVFDTFAEDRQGQGVISTHQGPGIYLTTDGQGLARFFARNSLDPYSRIERKAGRMTQEQWEAFTDDSDGAVMTVAVKPEARVLDFERAVPIAIESLFRKSVGNPLVGQQLRAAVLAAGYDGIMFPEPNRPEGWVTDPDARTVLIYNPAVVAITGGNLVNAAGAATTATAAAPTATAVPPAKTDRELQEDERAEIKRREGNLFVRNGKLWQATWMPKGSKPAVLPPEVIVQVYPISGGTLALISPMGVNTKMAQQLTTRYTAAGAQVERLADVAPAPAPAAPPTVAEQRETERTTFNTLSTDASLVGQPLDAILAKVTATVPDAKRAAVVAKSVHQALAKNAAELEKSRHRDPAVYEGAVAEAAAGIEGDTAPFRQGFDHAMKGKTKSTLTGADLAQAVRGYEAARTWMKTPEGRAWFDGKPVAKLTNTGTDLRRHMDGLRAAMKAGETDMTRAWRDIERATNRAALFAPLLPDDVKPGFRLYVTTGVRDNIRPFKDWLENVHTRWYGDTSYRTRGRREGTNLELILAGSRYPYDLDGAALQAYEANEDVRISYLQAAAATYLDGVREIIGFLDGAIDVRTAAAAFDKLYVDPVKDAVPPEKRNYHETLLNAAGQAIAPMRWQSRAEKIWTGGADRFQNLRTRADHVQTLMAQEATIALPTRATPLTPPKLDRVSREGGKDWRKGRDVTPAEFKAAFGFADVGFGKWVGARQDQDHLNYAWDALQDLAAHIGTDPKNIGFGGQLHFTIGALGHGKFAAHFSPNHPGPDGPVQVINLTNTKGDGTVYHEWIHALDHFLAGEWRGGARRILLNFLEQKQWEPADYERKADSFLTGGSYWNGNKRQDKVDAAIQGMDYYVGSRRGQSAFKTAADEMGKDYWGNEQELIARAAEAWAVDTLPTGNDYLVNGAWVADGAVTPAKGYRGTPYPTGAERARFAKVYGAMMKAIKWEGGKPTLTRADFEAQLLKAAPELADGERRRRELKTREGMTAYQEQRAEAIASAAVIAEAQKRDAAAAEAAELDRLAAAKIAAMTPPPAPMPDKVSGPLSDQDLAELFDQAAAEVREENQEKPDTPAPGEQVQDNPMPLPDKPAPAPKDGPSVADVRLLLDALAKGYKVIFASTDWAVKNGLPNINGWSSVPGVKVDHKGFGLMQVTSPTINGTFTAGGEMNTTPDGTSWTTFSSGTGDTWEYPKARVQEALDQQRRRLTGATAAPAAPAAPANKFKAEADRRQGKAPAAAPAGDDRGAAQLIAEAAKLGVTGANEALKGLSALFGKPGRLNSFGGGFDQETYDQAKPHFKAALTAFQAAGKTLKDLFKMLIGQFGDGVKPYAIQFAKDEGLTNGLAAQPTSTSPSSVIADQVADRLASGEAFDWRQLFAWSDAAFGGTQGEGRYTPKDAYDAMEAGVNRFILRNPQWTPDANAAEARTTVAALDRATQLLPTQTKRTAEQDAMQQFSTVPALAYVANWAGAVTVADTMMEPSAGIGGLAVFARNAGAKLILNELSDRRAAVLRDVFPSASVTTENAEQIHNILPAHLVPSVVVMNPPFSSSASRGIHKTAVGAEHVEQALLRLADGGRLVAIVGEGMLMDRPAFATWWKKITDRYDVRAAVHMDGAGYAKYGTTYDNAILVIDKVAPTKRPPVQGKASNYSELVGLLSEIRNDRPNANLPADDSASIERDTGESARAEALPAGGGDPAAGPGAAGGADVGGGGADAGQAARRRPGGSTRANRAKRPGGGAGNAVAPGDDGGGDAARGGADAAVDPGRPDAARGGESGLTLTSETAAAATLTDSVFENYTPQRLQVPGSQPHLGLLVQSAAMASVLPPAARYVPNLPAATIKEGLLSIAQLEAVVYAGQAHNEFLEAVGTAEKPRRGFFIGDGTGVGKGREIAGVMLDNLRQGRKRHVWVTEKQGLFNDAKRDMKNVGGDPSILFNQNKTGAEDAIDAATEGVLFTTYATLRSGAMSQAKSGPLSQKALDAAFPKGSALTFVKPTPQPYVLDHIDLKTGLVHVRPADAPDYRVVSTALTNLTAIDGVTGWRNGRPAAPPAAGVKVKKAGQSRLDQLVAWLGEDFDGVIAFDEAHNAGNAEPIKGDRGTTQPSAQALAVVDLQKRLPGARVVYVSATGATQVANLSFATRLGLWGPGTPFATVKDFINQISAGGLATMELIARDLKQQGSYLARSLSYEGVSYSRIEHPLTPIQRDIYDRMAEGWQVTLRNMDEALKLIGAVDDNGRGKSNAKTAAKAAFWGAQQRFFNQVITSMQMPSVIDQMERDLAAGESLVLQLVNTNEAQQTRAIAARKDAAAGESPDLEDLDLTPRDQLLQMVEKSFPVVQHETYMDENGKAGRRPVLDAKGQPVINREAVAMRDRLLKDLAEIRVPDGPLELILNHFGADAVAEVTGRTQRVVRRPDKKTGEIRAQLETRGATAARADADAFMAQKKRILVFSDAGGTGFSFHADLTKVNQQKRKHYLIQPGWRADKAVQGFGRTHRTNEASQPHYYLASTDIPAQKRFLSAIARRLDQLGALTKGQRDTANQGLFSEKDNLESIYATQAVKQFFDDLQNRAIKDFDFYDFLAQTGLEGLVSEDTGRIAEDKIPDTRLFLNRMLSLKIDMQNATFDAFIQRMEEKVEIAIARGELDAGMETIKALEARITNEAVAYTDARTGAETRLVDLALTQATFLRDFPLTTKGESWVVNAKSGKVWRKTSSGTKTTKSGDVVDRFAMLGTGGYGSKVAGDFEAKVGAPPYREISRKEAAALWQAELDAKPATYTEQMTMVTGAMLPIWDRLQGNGQIRVARVQTVDNQRLLGMVIARDQLAAVRKKLELSSPAAKLPPAEVLRRILGGEIAELANGWKLERARVSDDLRIELKAGSYLSAAVQSELVGLGLIRERISWAERFFVPTGTAGADVLAALTKQRPLVDLVDPRTAAAEAEKKEATDEMENIARLGGVAPVIPDGPARAPSVKRAVRQLLAQVDKGALSPEDFATRMAAELDNADWKGAVREEARANQGRQRGADYIRERLLQAKRRGELDAGAVDLAEWFILKNPALVDDLGVSIRASADDTVAGSYNPINRVIRLAKGSDSGDTTVHEILHHLERMMPPDIQAALRNAWARDMARARAAAARSGDVDLQQYFAALEAFHFGDGGTSARQAAEQLLKSGRVPYSAYQYFNPSEYWAVNGSRIVAGQFDASRSLLLRLRSWLGQVGQKLRELLGLRSDAPVLRALSSLARADGQFVTTDLLANREGMGNPADLENLDAAAIARGAKERLHVYLDTPGVMSWWHKTVGSPYNLAQRNPSFKRVFDAAQAFVKDVADYAGQAADAAPRIVPQLNTLRDLVEKKPLTTADARTLAKTMNEGTLLWTRDARGRALRMSDPAAAGLTAGVVWTDAELRTIFNATPEQVSLYREGRTALDKSLTDLALADMVNFVGKDMLGLGPMVMDTGNVNDGARVIRDHLRSIIAAEPQRLGALTDTIMKIDAKASRARVLMERGYAPLMRFGRYTLDVVQPDGTREFFGLYESRWERAKAAKAMAAAFPGATVSQGTMSQEQHKSFQGLSPDTAELFGEMLGLDAQGSAASSEAFQEYIKKTRNNRSAMKRLIERKGIAGYSEDFGRVLAGFITSNARQVSTNLHQRELTEAVTAVDKNEGDVRDAAERLARYVNDPQEEAATFRGFLFAQYLGGSIASAIVNLTQPLQTTLPYLSQYGKIKDVAAAVARAARDANRDPATLERRLELSLKRAAELGITEPQEVHQLQGQAMGRATLRSGDGSQFDDGYARATNAWTRLTMGWGKLFSMAEAYNRRVTFIAAFRVAEAKGDPDPFTFAEQAVENTQFVANKANKPRWARGAVGSVLFTFKSYSVNYLELVARMATAGEPGSPERRAGRKAALLAIAVLFLMGGAGGLPFVEDLDDVVTGLLQRLGYNFDTKQWRVALLERAFGRAGAEFIETGVSAFGFMPVDLSGRMGMGNLIPGTGLLTKKADYGRDVAELFGPAGDFVKRIGTGLGMAVEGDVVRGGLQVAPKAVTNALQGADMAGSGMYRDQRGKKVVDTNLAEAFTKGIGFQPTSVARVQEATFTQQNMIAQQRAASSAIADLWAAGIAQRDPDMIRQAQERLRSWNAKNPDTPVRVNLAAIAKKARTLNTDKAKRIEATAPKAMRADVRAELARELAPR